MKVNFFRNNSSSVFAAALMLCLCFFVTNASGQKSEDQVKLKFIDGQDLTVIGRYHGEKTWIRFPQAYKDKLREDVWDLGQDASGISVRFRTNASQITVRWTLKNDNVMDHMAFTGIKGVDLYAIVAGKWKYVNTARVKGKSNEFTLVKTDSPVYREYLLNLPLYDGVDTLLIGVNNEAQLSVPAEPFLLDKKPVVWYGSSITQGGCASRPGLVFTSIMERAINRPFINLGFSGSGTYDIPVAEAMSEIDASLYVIDCNPNTKTELIYERALALIRFLREKRPDTPILLAEGFYYVSGFGDPGQSDTEKKRAELSRAYKTLKSEGMRKLYYTTGNHLIGDDYEGTVDGVHPNDLGMMRISQAMQPVIEKLAR